MTKDYITKALRDMADRVENDNSVVTSQEVHREGGVVRVVKIEAWDDGEVANDD